MACGCRRSVSRKSVFPSPVRTFRSSVTRTFSGAVTERLSVIADYRPGPQALPHELAVKFRQKRIAGVQKKRNISLQKPLRLFCRKAGASFSAESVYLIFFLQTDETGILSVIAEAEFFSPVHPVHFLTVRPVIGRVKVKTGHAVGSVGPGIAVMGEQPAESFGKNPVVPAVDPVLQFVPERGSPLPVRQSS